MHVIWPDVLGGSQEGSFLIPGKLGILMLANGELWCNKCMQKRRREESNVKNIVLST